MINLQYVQSLFRPRRDLHHGLTRPQSQKAEQLLSCGRYSLAAQVQCNADLNL
jgi:hypothetical protein